VNEITQQKDSIDTTPASVYLLLPAMIDQIKHPALNLLLQRSIKIEHLIINKEDKT
jgi:hypothetical protein